jgi:hypothetical protein
MAEDTYGLDGNWSRIIILLPINNLSEILAAGRVISVARNLYSGATHSLIRPHVYTGYWWDTTQWVEDRICVLILDAPYHIDHTELDIDTELLKLEALDCYRELGSPQKIIWIMVYQAWKSP